MMGWGGRIRRLELYRKPALNKDRFVHKSDGVRRMLCLILAAVLMLSHGSMAAAVPHLHAAVDSDHHGASSDDHHAIDAQMTDADSGGSQSGDRSGDGQDVAAHVHLVAGLSRVVATTEQPLLSREVVPISLAMRQLASRAVAPLLEPPAL
ncbi:MAG: hypothetical protein MUC44_00190 [Beijerinckiaceae bacterium]|jgi:hypothetical protein|nr:hypothetical protein [Beijerinckiaceae bacterium]